MFPSPCVPACFLTKETLNHIVPGDYGVGVVHGRVGGPGLPRAHVGPGGQVRQAEGEGEGAQAHHVAVGARVELEVEGAEHGGGLQGAEAVAGAAAASKGDAKL